MLTFEQGAAKHRPFAMPGAYRTERKNTSKPENLRTARSESEAREPPQKSARPEMSPTYKTGTSAAQIWRTRAARTVEDLKKPEPFPRVYVRRRLCAVCASIYQPRRLHGASCEGIPPRGAEIRTFCHDIDDHNHKRFIPDIIFNFLPPYRLRFKLVQVMRRSC